MAVATHEATRQALVPALEVIGTSFTADDGVGMTRPIYSVIVGDPRPAEERAYAWSDRFGMYALDANLWTRVMHNQQRPVAPDDPAPAPDGRGGRGLRGDTGRVQG